MSSLPWATVRPWKIGAGIGFIAFSISFIFAITSGPVTYALKHLPGAPEFTIGERIASPILWLQVYVFSPYFLKFLNTEYSDLLSLIIILLLYLCTGTILGWLYGNMKKRAKI